MKICKIILSIILALAGGVFLVSSAESNNSTLPPSNKALKLINSTRIELDLNLLYVDPELNKSANAKCQDMREHDYWAHSRQGADWTIFIKADYRRIGEILASDFKGNYLKQHNAWLGSHSHKEAIVNPEYTHFGVGECKYKNGVDVTVVQFGG